MAVVKLITYNKTIQKAPFNICSWRDVFLKATVNRIFTTIKYCHPFQVKTKECKSLLTL